MIQVLHNARCSKSRECLLWLDEKNVAYETVPYLEKPLSAAKIKALLKKLRMAPIDLVRTGEPIWKSEYAGKALTDDEIVAAMAGHPVLVQRPVVINGRKAAIARPTENALKVL